MSKLLCGAILGVALFPASIALAAFGDRPNHYCFFNSDDKVEYYSVFLANGQRTNFTLNPGEEHALFIGSGRIGICQANWPLTNISDFQDCIGLVITENGSRNGFVGEGGNCPD